jgi:energy-coupling factor transporter ATP-binding protein EcfA2
MFRVIAIETLAVPEGKYTPQAGMTGEAKMELAIRSSRHDSVVKVLEEPAWFWFVKGYEYADGKIARKGDVVPDDFYSEKEPRTNVSAIVGENGMGKSSLLELLFRLINNTSYALREGLEVQKKALHYVRDIYARAWMENDGQIYSIEQNDNILKICYQDSDEDGYVFDYDKPLENALTAEDAKKKLRKLFYTIVVNYSQYAYNTGDYMMEWGAPKKDDDSEESRCWLSSLFHKNDAYQTPIVLNPFRENGNININRERDLTQTRLYNLVLNDASPLKKILRKKDAKSFIFDVDDDLTPEPEKRYYSKKVIWQLMQMQLLTPQSRDYKTVQDIGRRITAAWGHALGYTIESKNKNEYWKAMDDVRTINYIVYKTLKISGTYAKYYKYHDCFGSAKEVKKYVAELQNDNSHITLKIRRCLAFLYFHHYGTGAVNNGKIVGNEMTVKELKTAIENCVLEDDKIFNRLLKERYTTYYYGDVIDRHVWLEEELMPAPSFKTDILLADKQGETVRFSSLSSGEKQMIFSISTVIYQLWNINSAWMGDDILKNVQYRNVCLVFDEIELYAHPKYQLMLINLLIESIKSLAIFHVFNVNIILATHSPFVLSDIPASNILCLEDGKAIEPKQKISSFCANVYDILNNQFFMDRFVGDFANNKLDALIEAVNKKGKNAQEIERLKREAERIGDSFVRKLLLNKLAE